MFSSSPEEKEWENIVAFIPPCVLKKLPFYESPLAFPSISHIPRARGTPQASSLTTPKLQRLWVGVWGSNRANGRYERETLLEKRVETACVTQLPRRLLEGVRAATSGLLEKPGVRLCEHAGQGPRPTDTG